MFVILLLLAVTVRSASTAVKGLLSNNVVQSTNKDKDINEFVKLRSVSPSRDGCVWYHRGVMRNPLTGVEVAGVEGIEFNKYLGNSNGTGTSQSYLTKKVFVYVDAKERDQVLDRYRMGRSYSPLRKVQQPFRTFSQIVTVGVERDSNRLFSSVEFPCNRTLTTRKLTIESSLDRKEPVGADSAEQVDSASKPNTLRGWFAPKKAASYDIVHFMSAGRRTGLTPLSRWVSFSPTSEQGRGRSQEYYHIEDRVGSAATRALDTAKRASALIPSLVRRALGHKALTADISSSGGPVLATMKYSRFGECPSWFALNRQCSIEIESFKYAQLSHVPSSVVRLVSSVYPSFFSVPSGNGSGPTIHSSGTDGTGANNKSALSASPLDALKGVNTLEAFRKERDPLQQDFAPWHEQLRRAVNRAVNKRH